MEEENEMSLFENQELYLDNFDLEDEEQEQEEDINNDSETEQEDAETVGEDEVEEDVDNEENDSSNDSSPNLYSSVINVLHEQGIIPSFDASTKIESAEDLVNILKNEIEAESQKRFDDYVENFDISKISDNKKQFLDLQNITEESLKEDLNLAKELILQDYINQGINEERAKKYLKKTIDLGEDLVLEEALEAVESIKQFNSNKIKLEQENYKKQLKEQEEEQKRIEEDLKNKIYESENFMDIKATKKMKDEIYKTMTEIVGKNQNGVLENKLMQERSKNPIDFDIKMYAAFILTDGFSKLDKIKPTVKSKAINELENAIRNNKIKDDGTPSWAQDSNSYGSPFDEHELVI